MAGLRIEQRISIRDGSGRATPWNWVSGALAVVMASNAVAIAAEGETITGFVTVSAASTDVRDGSKTLATIKSGRLLPVLKVTDRETSRQAREKWLRIRADGRVGWVARAQVKFVEEDDLDPWIDRRDVLFQQWGQLFQQWGQQDQSGLDDAALETARELVDLDRFLLHVARREIPGETQALATYRQRLESWLDWVAIRDSQVPRFQQAVAARDEIFQIRAGMLGADHWQTVNARVDHDELSRLAALDASGQRKWAEAARLEAERDRLQGAGQTADALAAAARALALRQAVMGQRHSTVQLALNWQANMEYQAGDYAACREHMRQCQEIATAIFGQQHPQTAMAMSNLGMLELTLANYAAARPLMEQSLEIRLRTLGEKHDETGESLNNLGGLLKTQGLHAEAIPYYQRALATYRELFGQEHEQIAKALNNLGGAYYARGDLAEARPYWEQSLAMRRKLHGDTNANTARAAANLAKLLSALGDYDAALSLSLEAVDVRRQMLGRRHPDLAGSLDWLGAIYARLERWHDAADATDEGRRVIRRHLARVLPGLSDDEQLTFLSANDKPLFHSCLSLALHQPDDPYLVERSAAWIINGKAVAQQTLAERALLARETSDPAIAATVAELQSVRAELAAVTLAEVAVEAREAREAALAELEEHERRLTHRIGLSGAGIERDEPWIALDEVRAAIPGDSLLIEIARFDVWNYAGIANAPDWLPARYAAWVIPPANRGEVRLIDLGPADQIDTAVEAARQALRDAPALLSQMGEPRAAETLAESWAAARRLLWDPLAMYAEGKEGVILSPDGTLWLLPWAALPLDDGGYLLDRHRLSYVVSGRDLAAPAAKAGQHVAAPVIFADPDFDMSPGGGTADAVASRPAANGEPLRAAGPLPGLAPVVRLPATANEAQAIAPRLWEYCQAEPQVHLRRDAREGAFTTVAHPRVAVLSTHGFFLDRPAAGAAATVMSPNPLLRCGILLAGCNRRAEAGDSPDDGVLTGLEILGVDLRGTELVVLSACETGLGDVHGGEGVAGLRQAFQLSGARAVVATLWQIPDRDTAEITASFFTNLAAGQDKAQALRGAQQARIAARRERNGAAHPLYWGAFTITGR
jgi:CHAT domain-containing protein